MFVVNLGFSWTNLTFQFQTKEMVGKFWWLEEKNVVFAKDVQEKKMEWGWYMQQRQGIIPTSESR